MELILIFIVLESSFHTIKNAPLRVRTRACMKFTGNAGRVRRKSLSLATLCYVATKNADIFHIMEYLCLLIYLNSGTCLFYLNFSMNVVQY